jgi:hypothetical protein
MWYWCCNRSQHVQAGRFNTEDEVLHYVLDPFPWLLVAVYELYHTQQKLFLEENPDADAAASWLSQLSTVTTSATSGQSSAEESTKPADSDVETSKSKKTTGEKTVLSDGETKKKDDEIKQLKKKLEKQNKTVANMKKLSASNKKAQQEIVALKAIIAQGGGQTGVQLSGPTPVASGKSSTTEPARTGMEAPTKTKPEPEPVAALPTQVGHRRRSHCSVCRSKLSFPWDF